MVDLALSAIALAVYARVQNCPAADTEASSRYHRLLQVAQEQIAQVATSTSHDQNIDACLLAVFLMGRYEGTVHRSTGAISKEEVMSLPSWSHHDGAMAILKFWHDDPRRLSPSLIIKHTRRGLIKSYMLRNRRLPEWMLNGDDFGENNLELDLDRIGVRIVNLHYACASLLTNELDARMVEIEKLNNEAQELDKALQEWATQNPSTCSSYHQHFLEDRGPWPRKHFYSPTVHSYPSPGYAGVQSQYFATRMLINSLRLTVLDSHELNLSKDIATKQQRPECLTQLKAMADSLAASVAFGLERFKIDHGNILKLNTDEQIKPYLASLLVWPLTIASRVEGIELKQRQWFRSELARLGQIVGDRVLACTVR